jgi:hypothetical protein
MEHTSATAKQLFADLNTPSTRDQLAQFNELNGHLRLIATSIEKLPEPWRMLVLESLIAARSYALTAITAGEVGTAAGG